MAKWMVLIGALGLLLGCASIPEPEGPDDSLVIGYLALDFPDGFFEENKRTIESLITLSFINETRGRSFRLTTKEGWFQFLSNGTDSYLYDYYEYKSSSGSVRGQLQKKFAVRPRCVYYLGHLTITYNRPKLSTQGSLDPRTQYWDYDRSSSFSYNDEEVRNYLEFEDPASPWLAYEVQH
jgi:hypothetical protein